MTREQILEWLADRNTDIMEEMDHISEDLKEDANLRRFHYLKGYFAALTEFRNLVQNMRNAPI